MEDGVYVAFVFYYIIAAISILGNLLVLLYLFYEKGRKEWKLFTIILIYLHISILFEEITALPFIFKYSYGVCLAVEAFKFYFGLKNVFCILMLVRTYSKFIQNSTDFIFRKAHLKSVQMFLTMVPMVAFLPFADRTYTFPNHPWCSLPSSRSIIWEVCIQYLWVWLMLFYTLVENAKIIRQLYRSYDSLLMHNYLSKVGTYSVVSFISWIPRTIIRFANYNSENNVTNSFYSYFPLYVSGILYVILFVNNFHAIESFEEQLGGADSKDMRVDASIWEGMAFRNSDMTNSQNKSRESWFSQGTVNPSLNPLFGVKVSGDANAL
jgi:hypothetical protein